MLRKCWLTCVVFVVFVTFLHAQDMHFSDFYRSPLNLNPALAGDFDGNWRFSGIYRWQYGTISTPFHTLGLGLDARKVPRRKRNVALGYGILLNYDIAGDSRFTTWHLGVPLSLHLPLQKAKCFLSLGIMPLLEYNGIDLSGLRFPDQFSGGTFQSTNASSDNVSNTSLTYFNLAAGPNLKYVFSRKVRSSIGCSVFNIVAPRQSFSGDNSSTLSQRFCIHSSTSVRVASNVDIVPNGKFQFQKSHREIQFGCLAIHYIDNLAIPMISYGAWLRSRDYDAIILNAGLSTHNFNLGFSYDINVSDLHVASGGHGAFEISLLYIYKKYNFSHKRKSIKCPSYI